jgi:hypothetical protein
VKFLVRLWQKMQQAHLLKRSEVEAPMRCVAFAAFQRIPALFKRYVYVARTWHAFLNDWTGR